MTEKIGSAAVIVAAGRGLRMGGTVPKQYLELCGRPVLWHTVHAFEQSGIDRIIVVSPAGDEAYVREMLSEFTKVSDILQGGPERYASCAIGVRKAAQLAGKILVHDGVRALVTPELIDGVVDELDRSAACCPGVVPKDTIRFAGDFGECGDTPDRKSLRAVQTPQGFDAKVISEAYLRFEKDLSSNAVAAEAITDDAMLVAKYMGVKVVFTEGSYENIKITTKEDLLLARAILSQKN